MLTTMLERIPLSIVIKVSISGCMIISTNTLMSWMMLPANKQKKILLEIVRLDVVNTFTAKNNNNTVIFHHYLSFRLIIFQIYLTINKINPKWSPKQMIFYSFLLYWAQMFHFCCTEQKCQILSTVKNIKSISRSYENK